MDITKLADFGIIGIVLSYFIWKDMRTFDTFKESMREIVNELKELNNRIERLEKNDEKAWEIRFFNFKIIILLMKIKMTLQVRVKNLDDSLVYRKGVIIWE